MSPFPTDKQLKKPVCAFCGSSPGSSAIYGEAAAAVGAALAEASYPLVYGGGRRGLMGVVSQSHLKAGGYTHGLLPRALVARASEHTPHPSDSAFTGTPKDGAIKSAEGAGHDLLDDDFDGRLTMEVVGSMHERKAKMAQLSSGGFVVLPGGYGTFEELLEMVTWNQLGIHSVPVLVLNIGNFYTSLQTLVENAVTAGFIQPQNVKLMTVVNLPGGPEANADPAKAGEWGAATVKALQEWEFPAAGVDVAGKPALFSTGRFTATGGAVGKTNVPLWDLHVWRLRSAHAHFAAKEAGWGAWPGDEAVWAAVKAKLEATGAGDWRLRILLHPGARLEVQTIPAAAGTAAFNPLPSAVAGPRRKLYLDPSETPTESDPSYRLYKTEQRAVYNAAAARAPTDEPHPEVLLHAGGRLLESVTSNIAIRLPRAGAWAWVTPALGESTPFLAGTMRRHLLHAGVLVEGELGVADWERAREEGYRVIGFNGFRGVWEAEIV
ncbi:hypothetical protein Q8F55_006229 [Vanrija albida]|uniref:Cytokinin riboside 5'-monophosphate phosphoribohydrolase n=1 Tax=Vanrija albida TaxID=181172 RepID=A0ABR3PWQ1_9TREE